MRHRIGQSIAIAGLLLVSMAAGCEYLGFALDRTSGPPAEKAKYSPAQEPMLVLVESYGSAGTVGEDATRVEATLIKDLKDHKVAPLVDPQKVVLLKDANPDAFSKMGITEIGRRVGARQVLYVNVTMADIDTPTDTPAIRGTMSASARIVDANTAANRWPPDSQEGDTVVAQTDWIRTDQPHAQENVHDQMADRMATMVGNLFHDWHPDTDVPQDNQNQTSAQ